MQNRALRAVASFVLPALLMLSLSLTSSSLRAADSQSATLWNPLTWGNAWSSGKSTNSGRAIKRNTKPAPSTWDKMTSGTKSFASSTKQTLMPWSKSAKTPTTPITGSRSVAAKPAKNDKSSGGSSWLPSWLTPEPEKPEPVTVSDWVGKSRPTY